MNSSSTGNESPSAEILKNLAELPSLPAVLMDALEHLDDRSAVAAHIVEKIGQDPPLTARLLRIANSPFFGMPRQIGSLREALMLVGIDRVRELLVSACFPRLFPFEDGPFEPADFWCRSLVVAKCARTLADFAGVSKESAFTAGLLHDIGHLVLGCQFRDWFIRILAYQKNNDISLIEAERQVIGMDHMTLGERVTERWNFPLAIRHAILYHHDRPSVGTSESLSSVVYLANLIGDELADQEVPGGALSDDFYYAVEMMDIPPSEADAVHELARTSIEQFQSLLWP